MRTRGWAPVAGVAVMLALALAGCTHGGPAEAQNVADEVATWDGVTAAEGNAVADYDSVLALTVDIDPALDDDALVDLVHRIEDTSEHSGWSQHWNVYRVGENAAYASTMGPNALTVLIGIRSDPAYTEAYAGGGGEGVRGSFYVAGPPADDLLAHYQHVVELAQDAGGVQTNLIFSAATADGLVTVTGTYLESPADGVAYWQQLAREFAFDQVWVNTIETGLTILSLWVADEETRAAVEALAAQQDEIDVRVYVSE